MRWATRQDRPTMIACKTLISKGAGPKEGDPHSHGYTLFDEQIAAARAAMGWPHPAFTLPDDVAAAWAKAGRKGASPRRKWEKRLKSSDHAAAFNHALKGDVSAATFAALDAHIAKCVADAPNNATRIHSGSTLEAITPTAVEMVGGSADLTGSNNTYVTGMVPFDAPDYAGRYVHYGIREFGMAAAMNGMALHGGVIPYSGTFLAFADYSRPAIRLGALMGVRVIHVMTHDSIGLGEDGPTHQPVEQVASLRAMPNLLVFRPCDAIETAECWGLALKAKTTPSVMALSRQKTPPVRTSGGDLSAKGAYEISPANGEAQATLFSAGTEVAIAMAAQAQLQAAGIATRVVSTPCWELFEAQKPAYQASVIGQAPIRVAVEAGVRQGWDRFIGTDGGFVGMSGFGGSAPYERLYKEFGITAEAVVEAVKARL
jgi:transketolase